MKNIKRLIFIIILIFAVGFLTYFLGFRTGKLSNENQITSTLIEEQLLSAKELTTLKYKYTKVGSFENQSEFYGYKIPFTLKKFIISYDGEINAGVDLEKMEVNVNGNQINITLPEGEILSHEIDEESIKIFDERNSVFNLLTLEDYSNFRADEKVKTEQEVIEEGLLLEAKETTKEALVELLNINPQIAEEYEIVIK